MMLPAQAPDPICSSTNCCWLCAFAASRYHPVVRFWNWKKATNLSRNDSFAANVACATRR
jgi:hypothetical protein